MKKLFIKNILIGMTVIILWQCAIWLFHLPSYILPSPSLVGLSLIHHADLIAIQAIPTVIETLLGLFFGALLGIFTALSMTYFRSIKYGFLPLVLISQALPTFAIAPLLVVWLGYGMASKIAVTVIMLFFPITSAFYDGLQSTPQSYLDQARIMGASRWKTLWHIRVPAALPQLGAGLRIAASIAPIGAVIGEWVGASRGLGFLLLNADARLEIDLMFAVLIIITTLTLLLYFIVDYWVKRLITW